MSGARKALGHHYCSDSEKSLNYRWVTVSALSVPCLSCSKLCFVVTVLLMSCRTNKVIDWYIQTLKMVMIICCLCRWLWSWWRWWIRAQTLWACWWKSLPRLLSPCCLLNQRYNTLPWEISTWSFRKGPVYLWYVSLISVVFKSAYSCHITKYCCCARLFFRLYKTVHTCHHLVSLLPLLSKLVWLFLLFVVCKSVELWRSMVIVRVAISAG